MGWWQVKDDQSKRSDHPKWRPGIADRCLRKEFDSHRWLIQRCQWTLTYWSNSKKIMCAILKESGFCLRMGEYQQMAINKWGKRWETIIFLAAHFQPHPLHVSNPQTKWLRLTTFQFLSAHNWHPLKRFPTVHRLLFDSIRKRSDIKWRIGINKQAGNTIGIHLRMGQWKDAHIATIATI